MHRASRPRLEKAVPVRSRPRMASAIPGASRSITFLVPSGVRSVGEKPVPPVVTRRPANDDDSATKASETGATPSGTTARSTTTKEFSCNMTSMASPERSTRAPAATESETVRTFAGTSTNVTLPVPRTSPPRFATYLMSEIDRESNKSHDSLTFYLRNGDRGMNF